MDILLSKANINYTRLKSYLNKTAGTELMRMSEPCYYPAHHKHYHEFLSICGLKDEDLRPFPKRFWKGMPEATRLLPTDRVTMFYVFCMHNLLINKSQRGSYPTMMLFMGIRTYANLMYRQIPHCNDDYFRYALEHLAKTHLFFREKTIGNGIYFLSKAMIKRHTIGLETLNRDKISAFITEYRTRISQSIKSFASVYYQGAKGGGIKTEPEPNEDENQYQTQSQERYVNVINDIVKKITVYKEIDKKAIMDAKKYTKISTALATQLSAKLCNVKYTDNIRMCLQLFLKNLKNVNAICGKGFYPYVKKLMGIKRTREQIYFKQQVYELLMMLLKEIAYDKKYDSLTNQTKFSINSYLALYITMILRNDLCGLTADKRKKYS